MAKRRSNETREIEVLPSVTPEQGVKLVRTVIDKGRALLNARPITSDKYAAWSTIARDFLTKTIGSLSPNVSSVMDVGRYGAFAVNAGEEYWEQNRAENLEKKLAILEGLIEVLQTEVALDTPEGIVAKEYVPKPGLSRHTPKAYTRTLCSRSSNRPRSNGSVPCTWTAMNTPICSSS
ncbi:MAG: hypothetical protein HY322_17705 [Betaproteobacteria bacterium]|nr:hypothetical protein [Betaproteobacteria bacterium]